MRALLWVLAVLVVLWTAAIGALWFVGRRLAARRLFRLLPDLLALFTGLMRDRRVPRSTKVLLTLALAWIASPLDLIPEFIPVVGAIDDALIAGLVLRRVVKRAGRDVVTEHWRGEPETLDLIFRLVRI